MMACLAVHSCTFCDSSMPSTTSTHIFVMPMVNTPTVFMLLHLPKALLMVVPFLLNCGLTWLCSKQDDEEKDGQEERLSKVAAHAGCVAVNFSPRCPWS